MNDVLFRNLNGAKGEKYIESVTQFETVQNKPIQYLLTIPIQEYGAIYGLMNEYEFLLSGEKGLFSVIGTKNNQQIYNSSNVTVKEFIDGLKSEELINGKFNFQLYSAKQDKEISLIESLIKNIDNKQRTIENIRKFIHDREDAKFLTRKPKIKEKVEEYIDSPGLALQYYQVLQGVVSQQIIDLIAKNPKTSYELAVFNKQRFPEGEKTILNDGLFIYDYARDVIKGRWPEAEPYILKNPGLTLSYITNIAQIPGGIESIKQHPELYRKHLISIGVKEEELIETITKSPKESYLHAVKKKKRFPAGEKIILTSPEYSYLYAKDIIGGAWPEAESTISKDAQFSYLYAINVLKNRFPEGENAIKQNRKYYMNYIERFPKKLAALIREAILQT